MIKMQKLLLVWLHLFFNFIFFCLYLTGKVGRFELWVDPARKQHLNMGHMFYRLSSKGVPLIGCIKICYHRRRQIAGRALCLSNASGRHRETRMNNRNFCGLLFDLRGRSQDKECTE